jgi:hypothetical protein
MVTYALLPRLLFFAVARWQQGRAVRRAFARQPAVLALRDRLEHELVETEAEGAEAPPAPRAPGVRPAAPAPARGTRCAVLAWSGFPLDVDVSLRCAGLVAGETLRAGGGALADDAAAIEALRRRPAGEVVAVLVKAWEPPLLELHDFLRELRAALGDGRVVALVPLAQDAAGAPVLPDGAALGPWRSAVLRSGDPWLVLHPERDR